MATLDNIAQKAGVSHGTVSNVLNKRGNVSAKKIKLVEDAARALGYYVNESAQTLRKGMSKVIHLIIPFELRRKYDSFVSGAYLAISGTDYKIELTYFRMRQDLDNLVEQLATAIPSAIFCLGAAPKQAILDNYKADTPLLLVKHFYKIKFFSYLSLYSIDYFISHFNSSNFLISISINIRSSISIF